MNDNDQKEWDDLVYENQILTHKNWMLQKEIKEETAQKNKFQEAFRDSRVIKTFAIVASFLVTLILTMLVFNHVDPRATLNTRVGVFFFAWFTSLFVYYMARQIGYKIKGL